MNLPVRIVVAVALALAPLPVAAQFGQNKINYESFDWRVYASPHFDIHYYPQEEFLLESVVSYAESAYVELSEYLEHDLSKRVPLVIYRTHPEFEQTNIVMEFIPEGVGAFAEPIQNRMVLPLDEPPDKVYAVLKHELVHIFEYDILYEDQLGRALRGRPPLWLMEGLASFLAKDEDTLDQMVIRDAVTAAIVPSIENLNQLSFLTYRFGNAVFSFMESRWGKEGVRNFLWEYRKVLLTGNIGKAIKEAFGLEVDDFNREMKQYLRERYLPTLLEKEEPSAYGREIGFREPGVFTFAPTVSPGGGLIGVLATQDEEVDLWVLSGADGEPIRNVTRGFTNRYESIVAEVFSGRRDLSWSPNDDRVAFFVRHENERRLLIHDARTGDLLRTISMPGFGLQSSPAFSPDGKRIAFAANRAGVYDIYSYDLDSGAIVNHTDDEFVDANPSWSADGTRLLYNRRINAWPKIFTVAADDPGRKEQLTFGPNMDIMPVFSRDGQTVYYSSDIDGGIFNLHALDLATGDVRRLTDVVTGVFAPVEMDVLGDRKILAFTAYLQGRFRLYRMEVGPPVVATPAAERDVAPMEIEPFRPPLELTLDEAAKRDYDRKYDLEIPSVELGVTDDGTFYGNTFLSFSDLLGDKRWIVGLASVSTFSQLDIYHLDLERRINYIYHGYQYESFYYFPVQDAAGFVLLERVEARETGVETSLQIPFNRYYSFEGTLGLSDSSIPVTEVQQDFISGQEFVVLVERDFQSVNLGAWFVGDTARFHPWEAFHGQRFRIGAQYSPAVSGDNGTVTDYRIDYRKYAKLTRRSSFAWRLFGIISNAQETEFRRVFSAGGLNTIRGYDFYSFQGDRVYFSNFELRFPLVDRLDLPWGQFVDIRGVFFFDIGGAYYKGGLWLDPLALEYRIPGEAYSPSGGIGCGSAFPPPDCRDGAYDFWDSEENVLRDGAASYGLGFSLNFGIFEMNWVFARRTNFSSDNDGRWRSAFYIGNKF